VTGRVRLTVRFLLTTTLVLALSLAAVAACWSGPTVLGSWPALKSSYNCWCSACWARPMMQAPNSVFLTTCQSRACRSPSPVCYALVMDESGAVIWRSARTSLTALPEDLGLGNCRQRPGRFQFRERNGHYEMSYGVIWAEEQHERTYVFRVLVDKTPYQARLSTFRRHMTLCALGVIALAGAGAVSGHALGHAAHSCHGQSHSGPGAR
jgi:hypothetical protein